jgi:hypothetical protein
VPLYLVYYNDRWPTAWGELRMRGLAEPLKNYTPQADVNFVSDIAPAGMIAVILLIHWTVFQRVNVRRRLQRIHDPIATFFAGSVAATDVRRHPRLHRSTGAGSARSASPAASP